MDTEKTIYGIQKHLQNLIEKVVPAYNERGMLFGNERYGSWRQQVTKFLEQHLPGESQRFNNKRTLLGVHQGRWESPFESFWQQDGEQVRSYLESLIVDLEEGTYEQPQIIKSDETKTTDELLSTNSPLDNVVNICNSFHKVVKQLRYRHSNRETLNVNDEYDVQDLLHGLLHLYFEDIRAEEWVPSNAAKCTRVDFLLKNEGIIIEVKKTRQGLAAKEVGSQLIEDIHRYKTHPDCKTLVCFVYDPEERIVNPRGLEADLSKDSELEVHVLIRP